MKLSRNLVKTIALSMALCVCASIWAKPNNTPQILFYVSGQNGLTADISGGEAQPNFADKIDITATGPLSLENSLSPAIEWADEGVLAWKAPGNMLAARGTLSFYWRAGYAVDDAPFSIFRVGFADHSSWDMAWLRIDWNGAGFDAFVTDANLARTRVSVKLDTFPTPEQWTHITFAWDENRGVSLALDGKIVAEKIVKNNHLDFDVGLDQFGMAGRVMSPHQVQSRYNFLRGSHFAEITVFDQMLDRAAIAELSYQSKPLDKKIFTGITSDKNKAWLSRFGWAQHTPPVVSNPSGIRKVEFTDARDIKQWMYKGVDGIAETTWPGVYNRSRLPGRNDYFQLPDWNTYVEGGINYDLSLPNELVNHIEIRGASFGNLSYRQNTEKEFTVIDTRPKGLWRSVHKTNLNGGQLRITNKEQETPIQEIGAYRIDGTQASPEAFRLGYKVRSDVKPDYENLNALTAFIEGRYPTDERQMAVAVPQGASVRRHISSKINENDKPFVHVLIPASVSHHPAGKSVTRSWAYGWENMYEGLDGIEIQLPAFNLPAVKNGVIPFNLQIKDPIWPERNMLDISISLKPNEPYTLWLDLRDRILTDDSFYLTFASAAKGFNASLLDDAEIRLVFKDRQLAKKEHIEDRFNQVRDNWGNLVEEHTSSQRMALYRRAHADISDLLRADPEHQLGRIFWYYMSFKSQSIPHVNIADTPKDIPEWAHLQLEELKLIRHHINWWIDERQAPYGDFGGGLSDDSDLVQQWPGLAMMGVDREKITQSLINLVDAVYKNSMLTDGLSTIETDELHVYEEGINANSALFTLMRGDPVAAARLMETVRALPRVIKKNPAGNTLFSSNWYGGNKIYNGPNWEWQKPYSFYVVHPAILLGEYSGNVISRNLIADLARGYLAYSYQDEDGHYTLPNEINWRTGAIRGGEMNRGAGSGDLPTVFYTAYQWFKDPLFLKGIDYKTERGGALQLIRLNDNYIDRLNPSGEWRKEIISQAAPTKSVENYFAWESSGDKSYLADMYRTDIKNKMIHQYFNTEGHWWTDRAEARHDMLQRARMGGIALTRNRMLPGHTLEWFFNKDEAMSIALLMPRPQETEFTLEAFNTSDKAITGRAQGYLTRNGTWEIEVGIDTNGDNKIDKPLSKTTQYFGRGEFLSLTFMPKVTTLVHAKLLKEDILPTQRADLAVSPFDVNIGKKISVGIHNIGNKAAENFSVHLETLDGQAVDSISFNGLANAEDLWLKRVNASFALPKNILVENLRIRIEAREAEISKLNNTLLLKDAQPKAF